MKEEVMSITDITNSRYMVVKRAFDILISILALVLLSPLFIVIIIAIKLEDGGQAFFIQERIGLNGKLFKFYKFRSMVPNADELLFKMLRKNKKLALEYSINKKLSNDPRVTKVGTFIRKFSLDELPQFINVLNGSMSLIGNRPYLPREISDMGPYYHQIIMSKPGITGYWQTRGRNKTTFKLRCKMEAEYSNCMCLKMDIKIFFKTFAVLFKGL